MIRLETTYLEKQLKNPLIASCSPLTGRLDTLKRLEDAGVGAVVLPSMFEEQLEHDRQQFLGLYHVGAEAFAEAVGGYFPELGVMRTQTEVQLQLISDARESLSVPVIASLNGLTAGGWVEYAEDIEDAGADALELNLYNVPVDILRSAEEVEQDYISLIKNVRARTNLPIAVKVSPFFTSPGHVIKKFVQAGAQGVVLFNRFVQPDIDLDELSIAPNLQLSTSHELRLPLRWIALLRKHIEASLACTTGIHTGLDMAKVLLAGADVVQVTSAFIEQGPEYAADMVGQLVDWMEEKKYESISEMRGALSQHNCPEPVAFERANYMATLRHYTWDNY